MHGVTDTGRGGVIEEKLISIWSMMSPALDYTKIYWVFWCLQTLAEEAGYASTFPHVIFNLGTLRKRI